MKRKEKTEMKSKKLFAVAALIIIALFTVACEENGVMVKIAFGYGETPPDLKIGTNSKGYIAQVLKKKGDFKAGNYVFLTSEFEGLYKKGDVINVDIYWDESKNHYTNLFFLDRSTNPPSITNQNIKIVELKAARPQPVEKEQK
jgi:hypothetical protein